MDSLNSSFFHKFIEFIPIILVSLEKFFDP